MEEEKLRSAASMDNSYTKMLFSSNVPLIGKAWYLQVRTRTLPDMCQNIIYIIKLRTKNQNEMKKYEKDPFNKKNHLKNYSRGFISSLAGILTIN